ncbi:MAG: hypothetical protein IKX24_08345 [Prevotella sp.]|nr:hypothetical protein [Prevotella sp.]
MKPYHKNKRALILLFLIMSSLAMYSQQGLRINALFEGKIVPAKKMVETRVRGRSISKYKLSYFRSVRFKADDETFRKIDHLASQDFADDSNQFKDRSPYSSGTMRMVNQKKTFTQMYELAPRNGTNRYLCYKLVGDVITVIYMEGSLSSPEELKKLLKD